MQTRENPFNIHLDKEDAELYNKLKGQDIEQNDARLITRHSRQVRQQGIAPEETSTQRNPA
jgi:hypothetical protein